MHAGLGADNLVSIACNDLGQMLPDALEAAIVAAQDQGKVCTHDNFVEAWQGHGSFSQGSVKIHPDVVCLLPSLHSAVCRYMLQLKEFIGMHSHADNGAAGTIFCRCNCWHHCARSFRPLHRDCCHMQTARHMVPCGWVSLLALYCVCLSLLRPATDEIVLDCPVALIVNTEVCTLVGAGERQRF